MKFKVYYEIIDEFGNFLLDDKDFIECEFEEIESRMQKYAQKDEWLNVKLVIDENGDEYIF